MKPLPNSLTSEQALLWCMLIDDSIINLLDLEKKDFYDEINWRVYDLMKKIKSYWKRVDLIVIKEYLESNKLLKKIWWITYLVELTESVQISWNWEYYKNIIKEKSDRRKIIQYARQMEFMGYKEDKEMKEILWKIENISDYIFNLKPKENNWDTISYVNAYEEIKEKVKKRSWMLWIKSLYPVIDKYTKGFIEWKIYCLTAFSNVWKSKFSYNYVCDFLKKWLRVDYISLEVDSWMLFKELLCCYYNKTTYEMTYKDYTYDISDFEKLNIYDDLYKLEDIKTLIKSNKADIVFIDFIQNIQAPWSETEKMTKIAQEIQLLAIETWVIIFNISQANNESRFKSGDQIMPKWSWAIFASSDVMFTLNRDWKDLFYTIAKNKYWPTSKKFLVNPDYKRNIFLLSEEVSDDEIKY